MSEARKTAIFWAVGVVLGLMTWATTPRASRPAVVADRGTLFFPQFTDPNSATSLEVVAFDEHDGAVRPIKVQNRNGRWTIPSHHDYPADAKDRLAQTAGAVIAMRKDDFVSDNTADHERCGVLDPLDATLPGLKGRGTRVTVRGENERMLADVIIGNPAEGHEGFRYVRLPGQKRVYISRVGNLQISTNFGDWIERDLLQVNRDEIDDITVRNYATDETSGRVTQRETLRLQKKGDDWLLGGLNPGEELDPVQVNLMITNLVGLRIAGVLPKPAGITAMLTGAPGGGRVTPADTDDLARKGFYITQDGQLLSNEGEVLVHTTGGVFYTLRFGEIASGTPEAATPAQPAEGGAPAAAAQKTSENRYLFVMAAFDPTSARPPGSNENGQERAALLRARFAPWYYIISADSFGKIRARRADLVKAKGSGRERRT